MLHRNPLHKKLWRWVQITTPQPCRLRMLWSYFASKNKNSLKSKNFQKYYFNQVHPCIERPCPVHCEWSSWGQWTPCTITGITSRRRRRRRREADLLHDPRAHHVHHAHEPHHPVGFLIGHEPVCTQAIKHF